MLKCSLSAFQPFLGAGSGVGAPFSSALSQPCVCKKRFILPTSAITQNWLNRLVTLELTFLFSRKNLYCLPPPLSLFPERNRVACDVPNTQTRGDPIYCVFIKKKLNTFDNSVSILDRVFPSNLNHMKSGSYAHAIPFPSSDSKKKKTKLKPHNFTIGVEYFKYIIFFKTTCNKIRSIIFLESTVY